ncbi:GIY-YIG nuclease family protein [Salipiger bermudensis]|uniref:GIY-YIG nuclease family protein n=1 Tax=Salipiger bermudensis TaxID=344736 RepID=UPI001CD740B7|nr:GIY-YIG nuclease family protein [Salipiger bermudensis]MCA0964791.1 GIY-YIG nuclease family protein [Salipiger bermudensis]
MPHQTPSFPHSWAKPPVSVLPIHDNWQVAAHANGFEIMQRCADPAYVELKCQTCERTHEKRHSVILGSTPICPHCVEHRWREDATAAGVKWLGRDPQHRKRGLYRARCGHVVARQFELIKRIVAGNCALRCETCQRFTEEAEARTAGWELVGPSPDRGSSYRRYRHRCGHQQDVARANMQTERVCCGGCGVSWATAPSFIYCMRFILPCGTQAVKLGFSRNPRSRLFHQLMCGPDIHGTLLDQVAIPTGRKAQRIEKRLHRCLEEQHPHAILPYSIYQDHLRVRSEIYHARLEPKILLLLDDLALSSRAT